jgi:hypothetical protein
MASCKCYHRHQQQQPFSLLTVITLCGIAFCMQVVGGTLQVAGSAPSAPQLPVVLPPAQVSILRSLQPLVQQQQQQQQQQQGLQGSLADAHLQVSSTDGSDAGTAFLLHTTATLMRQPDFGSRV